MTTINDLGTELLCEADALFANPDAEDLVVIVNSIGAIWRKLEQMTHVGE